MSEQDNVRLVQEGYADFSRGDIAALLGKFAADIEWVEPGVKNNPLTGTYKGVPVSIVSIGMGAPNMDFFVREGREVLSQ